MVVLMDRNPLHLKKQSQQHQQNQNQFQLPVADQDEGLLVGNMHIFNGIPSRQPIQWLVPRSLFSHPAGIWTCKSMKVTSTLHLLVQSHVNIPFLPNADQHMLDPLSNY